MGKGADPNRKDKTEHVSRPLASLKDPTSFGPPPKNVNYHGGAALPNTVTPQTGGLGAPLSSEQISSARPPQLGGLGAPLTSEQISSANRAANAQEDVEEEKTHAGPPLPYRADRTGLKTDHLPPPPVHRGINRTPEVAESAIGKPKPGLPPRLPSRQPPPSASTPTPAILAPPPTVSPPTYEAVATVQPTPQPAPSYGMNQAAVSRLGNAGISVPALGIGSEQASNPWSNETSQSTQPKSPPVNPQPATNQLSELQARFARMNSSASITSQQTVTPPFVTPAQSPAPATPAAQAEPQGSTWAEKQAAMRTAQSAYKDPSSVSVSDAASAARTANSFRERHKDSIDAAGARANGWNKKYNVTGRLNSFLEKHTSPTSENPPNGGLHGETNMGQQQVQGGAPVQTQPQPAPQSPEIAASISRKPPPPPPPKKPANMHGSVAPPPVPLGTKPSYS